MTFDVRKRNLYKLMYWDQIPNDSTFSITVPNYEEQLVKQHLTGKINKNNWYIQLKCCFNHDFKLNDGNVVPAYKPVSLTIPHSLYDKWQYAECKDEAILEDDAIVLTISRFKQVKKLYARWAIDKISRASDELVKGLPEVLL